MHLKSHFRPSPHVLISSWRLQLHFVKLRVCRNDVFLCYRWATLPRKCWLFPHVPSALSGLVFCTMCQRKHHLRLLAFENKHPSLPAWVPGDRSGLKMTADVTAVVPCPFLDHNMPYHCTNFLPLDLLLSMKSLSEFKYIKYGSISNMFKENIWW